MSQASVSDRYLRKIGKKQTPADRRRLWASEHREFVAWEQLSKGERRRRRQFARLIAQRKTPTEAIRIALGVDEGPVPEVEDQESFDKYWTNDLLAELSNQWLRSPYFRNYAKTQVRAAHNRMGAAAELAVDTLVEACTDPTASKAARVKAAQIILGGVGIVSGSEIAEDVGNEKETLQEVARTALRLVPKTADGAGK